MTVVNFLCRREKAIMKKKAKITTSVLAAVIFLRIIALSNQGLQEPPVPEVRPVSASFASNRDNTPPTENKAIVGEENAEISTQGLPQDSTPTETDFEPPNPADITEILTDSSALRDNPAPSKSATTVTVSEPRMGDTRTVDGQKQVYFLGFGWIEDNEEPNQGVYIDGDGDINKMVGIMD